MNRPYKSTSLDDLTIICSNVPNRDVLKAILTELSHRETTQEKNLEAILVQHLIHQGGDGPVIALNPAAAENQANATNIFKTKDVISKINRSELDPLDWNTNPKPSPRSLAEMQQKAVTESKPPISQKSTAIAVPGQTGTIKEPAKAVHYDGVNPASNRVVADKNISEKQKDAAAEHRYATPPGNIEQSKDPHQKHNTDTKLVGRKRHSLQSMALICGLVIAAALIGYSYFFYDQRSDTTPNLVKNQAFPGNENKIQKGHVAPDNVVVAQQALRIPDPADNSEFTREVQKAPEVADQPKLVQEQQISLLKPPQIPVTQDIQTGLDAYESGDYPTALREFRTLSEQGNAVAQYHLGLLFEKGQGVPEDYGEAMKWYRISAEQGNADAQLTLGINYYNGEDILEDHEEAARWFRESAEQGNADAQNRLGFMYEKGYGLVQNHSEATKWYRRSAEQGNANAQKNLSTRYFLGLGENQDNIHAHMWAIIAASQGHKTAIKVVDLVAKKMTKSDISKANELAIECVKKNYQQC